MQWYEKGALAILAAITGYILFNVAVIESGNGLINLGIMNFFAGAITWVLFRKEVKSTPHLSRAIIGVLGIFLIVFGLRFTHISLQKPGVAIEFIYDLVVLSSVLVWSFVERPLGLDRTKFHRFDIILHLIMAFLVVARIWYHWEPGWTVLSFLPGLIAVAGYHVFNIGIRLAQKDPEKTRATNVAMNMIAGAGLVVVALMVGGEALTVGDASWIGVVAIVTIVYGLGVAYKNLGPKGLSSLVPVATYDGLLILAPIAMLFFYNTSFDIVDAIITLGFIAVMAKRVVLHNMELKKNQAVQQQPPQVPPTPQPYQVPAQQSATPISLSAGR